MDIRNNTYHRSSKPGKIGLFIILVLGIFLVIVLLLSLFWDNSYFKKLEKERANVNNYGECVKAGGRIITSLPLKCEINGKTYTKRKAGEY